MTTNAAVAVIGGGVIGASIAYHLALNGVDDVVIIDRALGPGAGSTGRATGGFRAQFATPINIQLSLFSREALLRFKEETGVDPGYEQVGYLWLALTAKSFDAVRTVNRMQRENGVPEATVVDASQIAELNPLIATDELVGGAFCPSDGYIRPLEILRGYLESAERLGVRFLWDAECIGLNRSGERIDGVVTSKGVIAVKHVVNAAGAWAASIAGMADVTLPVTPVRRQAAFTVPTPVVPPDMPMTLILENGFHVRARDGRALFSWPNEEQPGEPAELKADDDWIDNVAKMARKYVPAIKDVAVDRASCYAGLYEMSPDHHVILGRSPACENMFFANGSSGHGVMHSPAIGAIIADMIVSKEPPIDVSSLRPSRFDEGKSITAAELI